MIDLDRLRTEFAEYLNKHTHTRWGMDAALLHCCRISYEQGLKDAVVAPPQEAQAALVIDVSAVRREGASSGSPR